jgi:hypothetical protein
MILHSSAEIYFLFLLSTIAPQACCPVCWLVCCLFHFFLLLLQWWWRILDAHCWRHHRFRWWCPLCSRSKWSIASPKSRFPMISSSSSTLSSILIVVTLINEFTSLEEHPDDSNTTIVVVLSTDGSDFVGCERWVAPKELTRKLRLPIVGSIPWSKLAKTRLKAGGWVWKSTVPKDIWFPLTFKLLLAESENSLNSWFQCPESPWSAPIDEG